MLSCYAEVQLKLFLLFFLDAWFKNCNLRSKSAKLFAICFSFLFFKKKRTHQLLRIGEKEKNFTVMEKFLIKVLHASRCVR